jgi:hypothetical protein
VVAVGSIAAAVVVGSIAAVVAVGSTGASASEAAGLTGLSGAEAPGLIAGSRPTGTDCVQEADKPLVFLRADLEEHSGDDPFVVIVRSPDELSRWLRDSSPNLQWLQIEGLLADPDAWAFAAQGVGEVPVDVVLSSPGSEFADLYRLVDVLAVRDVRVTMPATPGFLKAVRLAASLGLPVRILPGQPSTEALEELGAALKLYLHDPMVETPIEFFHSTLASMRDAETGSLWLILEEDPAVFRHGPKEGALPRDFVRDRLAKLISEGGECAPCPWQPLCQGYFKWPDPSYSCRGVKQLFATLRAAADDIGRDLAARESQPASSGGATP